MDEREYIKREILQLMESDEEDARLPREKLEYIIVPIVEEYLLRSGAEIIKGDRNRYCNICVSKGYEGHEGLTFFNLIYVSNGRYLSSIALKAALRYSFKGLENVSHIVYLFIGEYERERMDNYMKRIELANESRFKAEAWDFDKVADIISKKRVHFFDQVANLSYFQYFWKESRLGKNLYSDGGDARARLINDIQTDISEYGAAFFLGAGVSQSAGLPGWNELIRQLNVKQLNTYLKNKNSGVRLDDQSERDILNWLKQTNVESPLIQARLIKNGLENANSTDKNAVVRYEDMLRNVLYEGVSAGKMMPSDLIRTIGDIAGYGSKGKVDTIITYNYDDLIEMELDAQGKARRSIYSFGQQRGDDEVGIYHVHGYLPQESMADFGSGGIVFSEDEYHGLMGDPYHWANLVQINALRERACIFIGLSMNDPNLRRILDLPIFRKFKAGQARHCVFIERTISDENGDKVSIDKLVKASGNLAIKEFMENNMKSQEDVFESMGIKIVWVENNDEIPVILRQIFMDWPD